MTSKPKEEIHLLRLDNIEVWLQGIKCRLKTVLEFKLYTSRENVKFHCYRVKYFKNEHFPECCKIRFKPNALQIKAKKDMVIGQLYGRSDVILKRLI